MCEMHKDRFSFISGKARAKAGEPNKPVKMSRMQQASVVNEHGMTMWTQLALAICLWELEPGNQEHIDMPIKCTKKL